jgi:murein DD-endopeptidase MepM/ murein hydrolase activator NlpD
VDNKTNKMDAKNIYQKPVKEYTKIRANSPAHKGKLKYAIDFSCKEETKIYASLGGKVVYVKQDSKVGGPDKKYWYDGNRIVIKHMNDEYTGYEHLKFNGSKVKVGQTVRKGQLIGYTGNTGFTFGPHLHFEVFRFNGPDKERDFETLKIKFEK